MKIDDHILATYLNGTAEEAERQQVEQWIRQDPKNQQEFERFKIIWDRTGELRADQPVDADESWPRFEKLRNAQADKVIQPDQNKLVQWRSWIARAAAVLLVCTLSYMAWDAWRSTADQKMITSAEQMSDILLPDGSRVWLNKHSQLSYPKEFTPDERRVKLTGEAYFEVIRDTQRPFLIHGGDTEVRVLGTSFNVNTIREQPEVVVNTGKVAFYSQANPEEKITLQAGEKGTYHSLDHRLIKSKNQDPNYLSWKTGRLLFENMTIEETLQAIERHYGVTVTIDNPGMTSCRINTRFDNQSLSEVLDEIGLLLGGSYEQTHNEYVLKGNGCH